MALETMKESLREDIKYHSRAASSWLHFFNEMQRTNGANIVFGNGMVKIERVYESLEPKEVGELLLDIIREFAQKMCEQHAMVRMGLEVELQALIDKEN